MSGRLVATLLLVALTGTLVAPAAAAHADVVVTETTHRIPAGAVVALPAKIHYHRLVGDVEVEGAGAIAVGLRAPGAASETLAGPGSAFPVNALVACCKGEGYSAFEVLLENRGRAAVEASVRLVILHDGISVLGENSEDGAAATPIALFLVTSVALSLRLLRAPAIDTSPRRALARVAAAFGALWALATVFAAWGVVRYGGGPVAGTLAATADLPATGNPILNTHSFVVLAFMGLWIAVLVAWTAAAQRAGGSARGVGVAGVALGLSAVVACMFWAVEYGTVLVPGLVAASAAAFPLLAGARLAMRAGQ